MVKLYKTTIIACLALYLCLPSFVYAKRVALVIGNGAYQEALLKNPVNDANDMALSLERLGFEVIKVTDANLRDMFTALDDFTLGLSKKDVALFFYAGHGVQVQGENYLLPIGSQIQSVSDIRYEAFPVGRVVGRMEEVQSMNIIILDACRNNPLSRGFKRSLDRGLAIIQRKPEGTFIAYATAPGKTAADGDGENGLFTSAILKHMVTVGLNISTMLRKVRIDVKKMSTGKQVPWSESSLTQDFYFAGESRNLSTNEVHEPAKEMANNSSGQYLSQENLFWETVKDSNDISSYKAYNQQYPHGAFHSLALLKINQLRRKTVESVVQHKSKPSVVQSEKVAIGSETDRISEFLIFSKHILYDEKENLEWMVGLDNDTSPFNAKKWIAKLHDKQDGWRMPSVAELQALHKNGLRVDNLETKLKLTSWKVWSKEVSYYYGSVGRKQKTKCFDFKTGKSLIIITEDPWNGPDPNSGIRVFAVRSSKS